MNGLWRLLSLGLLLLFVALQVRLWVGEGSLAEVVQLQRQLKELRLELDQLSERNAALNAEVADLRAGTEAIEARARRELGMIRDDESFYQVFETTPDTGDR